MKLNKSQLELKKICISQAMFDPHVLMNFISPYTIKRAEKILKEIRAQHEGSPMAMEYAVAEAIFDIYKDNPRRKRFAYVLLMKALDNKMVSKPTYVKIRESMGVSEYTRDTEEFLNTKEEEKKPDVFDMVTDTSRQQTQGEL